MSHRKRRGGGHGGEFHVDERWMASYMDMVTVLMCLFIVLYAMSTVDSHKYDVLKNSLASGFGVTNTKKVDLSKGVPVPKDLVKKNGAGFTAGNQTTDLKLTAQLKAKIDTALKKADATKDAKVTIDSRGVTIGLVGSRAYFEGNSAVLLAAADKVLKAVVPVVSSGTELITVEGHADPHGNPAPYASDWSLAAARSTAVLEYLVDHGSFSEKRISSTSFGSSEPVKGTTVAATQRNRRVDIVLHTLTAADSAAVASSATKAEASSKSTTKSSTATKDEAAASTG
jgi:chemotaxis protein MotB